jgi:hypothetical protein
MKVRDDFVGVIHLPIEGLVLKAGDDIPEGVQVGAHVTGVDPAEAEVLADPDQDSADEELPSQDEAPAESTEPSEDPDGHESDGKPRGNASTETWVEYAKSQGASDEDLDGLTRDEIRDLYNG